MTRPIFTAAKQKEFVYELVVAQGDITPYGSASFINYFRWFNIARDALLQWARLGFDAGLRSLIETEVSYCILQYKRATYLQDEIIVKVNSSDIKNNEFTLLFTLIRKDSALIVSLGKQSIRFRNSQTGNVVGLSEFLIKNVLKPIEVNERTLLLKY